jgi:hypothetical protein
LIKEVVEPVPYHLRGTGFYCNLFLVPKKSGGFRPVLNLKPLNHYVQRKGFKLDSIRSVKNTLQRGDFATSLDLQDAYLHIPIRPMHKQFLRFAYGDDHFQFRALPFGLSSAPRAFCRTLAPVVQWCHFRGLRLLAYLDDWLLLSNNYEKLDSETRAVRQLLVTLGWILAEEKCQLQPLRKFPFLGAVFDTQSNVITPSEARVRALARLAGR